MIVAALVAAVSFMSCGNKTSKIKQSDTTQVDSVDTAQVDSVDSINK